MAPFLHLLLGLPALRGPAESQVGSLHLCPPQPTTHTTLPGSLRHSFTWSLSSQLPPRPHSLAGTRCWATPSSGPETLLLLCLSGSPPSSCAAQRHPWFFLFLLPLASGSKVAATPPPLSSHPRPSSRAPEPPADHPMSCHLHLDVTPQTMLTFPGVHSFPSSSYFQVPCLCLFS